MTAPMSNMPATSRAACCLALREPVYFGRSWVRRRIASMSVLLSVCSLLLGKVLLMSSFRCCSVWPRRDNQLDIFTLISNVPGQFR